MVVCESVPTSVSGYAVSSPNCSRSCTTGARYSRFTWWTIPVPGGTTLKLSEGALGELEQLVALDVALQLELHVEPEGALRAVVVDLDRVVDHQVAGDDRIDPLGIALHPRHRVAHGGEVHHAGHAGEVLEHHPGRHERDLAPGGAFAVPACQIADAVLGDHAAAGVSKRVLEEDADGEGEPVELGHTLSGKLGQSVHDGGLGPEPHGRAGAERIGGLCGHRRSGIECLGAI